MWLANKIIQVPSHTLKAKPGCNITSLEEVITGLLQILVIHICRFIVNKLATSKLEASFSAVLLNKKLEFIL